MTKRNDGGNTPPDDQPSIPPLEEVIEAIKELVRAALQKDRPQGLDKEATILYRVSKGPQGKTDALVTACLSDWHSLIKELRSSEHGPLNADEVAVLLIHRTLNRWHRKKYRDDQTADQVDRGNARGKDGENLPFDPPMAAWDMEKMEIVRDLITVILKDYSPRDRMIVELRYFEQLTEKEIVERVKKTFPGIPISTAVVSRVLQISTAVVSRVLQRFEDEFRGRWEED